MRLLTAQPVNAWMSSSRSTEQRAPHALLCICPPHLKANKGVLLRSCSTLVVIGDLALENEYSGNTLFSTQSLPCHLLIISCVNLVSSNQIINYLRPRRCFLGISHFITYLAFRAALGGGMGLGIRHWALESLCPGLNLGANPPRVSSLTFKMEIKCMGQITE